MKLNHLFITGLLLSVAFVACNQKEELPEQPEEVFPVEEPVEGEFSYIFKVASDQTKTTFAENHVAWEDGDKVASYASSSKNQSSAVSVSGGDVTISVKSTVALTSGDVVYAYYPYSKSNNEAEASAITMEIPASQVSGSADAMPMVSLPFTLTGDVAADTDTEVGTLQFMNLGSVIKLNIYSSDASFQGETIESVTFNAGAACAGSFTYNLTTASVSSPADISGYTEEEVVSTGRSTVGTSSGDAGVYYLVVAPGSYSGSFIIRTNRADYTYTSGKTRDYERAHVKPLNIDLSSVNWVANTSYDTNIDSPREFLAFLAGTSSGDTADYTITADLNMDGYSLTTSASGFGGTLDGGDHTISNLSASIPMFIENSGAISNLVIDETCEFTVPVGDKIFGTLVKKDQGGTYDSVRNKANVTCTITADMTSYIIIGGLVGTAYGATFTSCTNSGHIKIDATGYKQRATGLGGLVGYAESSTFASCVNRGPVTSLADYGDPNTKFDSDVISSNPNVGINVGGILGCGMDFSTDSYCTFTSCHNESAGIITLTYTQYQKLSSVSASRQVCVGGILGRARGNMHTCKNYAPINVTAHGDPVNDYWKRQNCVFNVGGIAGAGRYALSFDSCTNEGDITFAYDGSYDSQPRDQSAVGGICGWEDYDGSEVLSGCADIYAKLCKMKGNITVSGEGSSAVGGIFGINGQQRGNTVESTISYTGRNGDVGGLAGCVTSAGSQIRQCSFTGSIVATRVIHSEGDEKYFAIGGLMGWYSGGAGNTLIAVDDVPCTFTGSVNCTNKATSVGLIVGWASGSSAINFGGSDNPIQASGTFARAGLSEITINSGNVETYAIGNKENASATIYVSSETPVPANLTLMSFNIREGSNWSSRKSPIVSMINGESPDIIGLQEVKDLDMWDHMTEAHPWDYLRDNLTAYTGYRYSDKTNAILYKTSTVEMSDFGHFWLRDSYSSEGTSWDGYERTVLYATVREKASGRNFFYINTHFPMNNTDGGWAKCTALLESRIAALNTNNYPVILMGDFNCVYGNACWDSIKTWMYNTRYAPGVSVISPENKDLYTYNAFGDSSKDRNKVDHIWVSKSITVDSYVTLTTAVHDYGGYTTNGEKFLSDHYPIIAHIS
jgi:endonuclease/exonuclease/phosphatase family metal-dependent hydrolase